MKASATTTRGKLFDRMASGGTVVTANQRLARTLLSAFEDRMLRQNAEAWPTPRVHPYRAWLRTLWQEASLGGPSALPTLLTPEQETQLWCEAIRPDGRQLLRITATAKRAQQAWATLNAWQIPLDSDAFRAQENSRSFRRWARRFAHMLEERQCISDAGLERRLAVLCRDQRLDVGSDLTLVGFYELTPSQAELLDAFEAMGCASSWASLERVQGRARRVRAGDGAQELKQVAAWARRCLDEDPRVRVGIVVPDLEASRLALERALRRQLAPASHVPGAAAEPPPWNLSLGRPLSDEPIVATALQLLALMEPVFSTDRVSALLTSPWWGMPDDAEDHAAETSRRALLDAELRRHGDERMSLRGWRFHARRKTRSGNRPPWHSGSLIERLDRLFEAQQELPRTAPCADWAGRFSEWLSLAGWCAGRRLDSRNYQVLERWAALLGTFSALEDFTHPLDPVSARQLLERLARDAVFQPQSPAVPVQVLGVHESNEQQFDRLWVMGLHDAQWPPASSPDPFIPADLQREHRLPHCDPQWALDRARLLTERWACSADEVVFSYPAQTGDEPLQPSPLLAPYPLADAESLTGPLEEAWIAQVRATADPVPAPEQGMPPMKQERMQGGTGVLRSFSSCPFRGQAEYRLGAEALRRIGPGLDPLRRGQAVHRVLEWFWGATGSQAELLALQPEALARRIGDAVDAALDEVRRRHPLALRPRFAALERARLEQLTADWLAQERQRAPFTVIGFETEAWVEVGGGLLRVFLDRIDELEDARRVIVDYKTGKVSTAGWFGERPDDPQLPLYSLSQEGGDVAGLSFAQVRTGECRFSGVVAAEGILPGLPPPRNPRLQEVTEQWPRVLTDWSQTLQRLAAGYRAGDDRVDPKRGTRTCTDTYCELAPLCRIHTALNGAGDA